MKSLITSLAALCLGLAFSLRSDGAPPKSGLPKTAAEWTKARELMVEKEIASAGIKDQRVVESLRTTPRHEFMPMSERENAYLDMALPIGEGQTISPPFIVAYMTEQLEPKATDKVLEIGTGSGFQASVLSPLVQDVYSIEIKKKLGEKAARTIKRLGYKNIHLRIGDGFQGWAEAAPFDKIIVTCSPEKVPEALVSQLKEGGRMIVPVGERYQQTLYLFEKREGELKSIALLPTLFVPMTGKAEDGREKQPDPANPQIHNGSFEEDIDGQPLGWHYQRQLELVEEKKEPGEEKAREGKRFITFHNEKPGRGAQALQGMAIDGRKVQELELSAWVKAKNIRAGRDENDTAIVGIQFYDERRGTLSHTFLGPWLGTFDWQRDVERVKVPAKAREAIIAIGLRGATGDLSLDDIQVKVVPPKKKER